MKFHFALVHLHGAAVGPTMGPDHLPLKLSRLHGLFLHSHADADFADHNLLVKFPHTKEEPRFNQPGIRKPAHLSHQISLFKQFCLSELQVQWP